MAVGSVLLITNRKAIDTKQPQKTKYYAFETFVESCGLWFRSVWRVRHENRWETDTKQPQKPKYELEAFVKFSALRPRDVRRLKLSYVFMKSSSHNR